MVYKRLEIYVGWTCNQKCTYCREYEHMEKTWKKKVSTKQIFETLIKYKKKGFNHVTFLGGEPFIQPVFKDALNLGKKMGYTILVTTNSTTLHIDNQASKYLPYIDELILSVEAIDKELQQKISRTNVFVEWDKVFVNINKYWKGTYFKVNIVITKDNLGELFNIVKYILDKGVKDIAITYPDIGDQYYDDFHIYNYIMPKYEDCTKLLINILELCEKYIVNLKIVDFPFCVFPKEYINKIIHLSDDFDYDGRLKIEAGYEEDYRDNESLPRERQQIKKCRLCNYNNVCWGPGIKYIKLFGDLEIKSL